MGALTPTRSLRRSNVVVTSRISNSDQSEAWHLHKLNRPMGDVNGYRVDGFSDGFYRDEYFAAPTEVAALR